MIRSILLILGFVCWARGTSPYEQFDEGLQLSSLRDGKVMASFAFDFALKDAAPRNPNTLLQEDIPQHYSLFPLSLGQVLREYAVTELHLSLNAGKWDYENWGYPKDMSIATGAELWAWMGDTSPSSIDERWKGLRNAMGGLFCASLGSLDDLRTTSPRLAFRPEGRLPAFNHTHHLRHAFLPSEHVCTENLTPFVKLLPCKSSSGIATLLNPHKLFDANWHGMAVHVQWSPERGVTLSLSVQAVFDPIRLSKESKRDWSLNSLFGRTITRTCNAATKSVVKVSLPNEGAYSINPEPATIADRVALFDVSEGQKPLDVSLRWLEPSFSYPLAPPLYPLTVIDVTRTLSGSTQSRGRLSISIRNNLDQDLRVVYLETMPWLVQFSLHTMKITVDDLPRNDIVSRIFYVPPEAHGRPTLFESVLTLPAKSIVRLSLDVTKAFLRYTEHPPDAQRGWDLPPAVFIPIPATIKRVSGGSTIPDGRGQAMSGLIEFHRKHSGRIYTPTLLVDLATPDFSMPYNVIIMSSTLIALIFGSIFNLLTRQFVAIPVDEPAEVKEKAKVE